MAAQLARVLGLALAYWGAAKLFGVLAAAPGFAVPMWPSAGIALTRWAGDTMGLRIFGPLLLTVAGDREHACEPRRNSVTIPLVVFLAALTALFEALQHWESKQPQVELAHDSHTLARGLTR